MMPLVTKKRYKLNKKAKDLIFWLIVILLIINLLINASRLKSGELQATCYPGSDLCIYEKQ